jgi:DNA-binding MarR family transcriptional regulator
MNTKARTPGPIDRGGSALMNETQTPTTTGQEEARITLGLLNAVEQNSALTQRSVARDLGIALGLANAYLKRCARKGLIKIKQAPANRYAYYLTPQGFTEKSRLTAEYLTSSLYFFRTARRECGDVMADCVALGWRRIALAGTGDLGEIATLCAAEHRLELAGFFDPRETEGRFAGLPVASTLDELGAVDGFVVTDLRDPQGTFEQICAIVPRERVRAPGMLRISREPPTLMD